jgi:SAM-dependent methyltransferase
MTADDARPNAAQIDYWNAGGGATWAAFQALLDCQLDPLGRVVIDVLTPKPGDRILDVGCGCGHTSLQLAAIVGVGGRVVGADISRPMLDVARTRDLPAGVNRPVFVEADAQVAHFDDAPFDAIFSRFGVMFFVDTVAAFANLKSALRPGGRFGFVAWRSPSENLWMRLPAEAAAPFMPPRPPSDPDAPGPYRLADGGFIERCLAASGFADISIRPHDVPVGGLRIEDALKLALKVGPLGAALREYPDKAGDVIAAVRDLLERHIDAEGRVFMPSASWIVTARA